MASHTARVRIGALVGAVAIAAVPAIVPTAAAAATPAAAPTPTPAPAQKSRVGSGFDAAGPTVAKTGRIAWKHCMGMQCGELEVPLDYADPAAGTTTLAIARRPADDPSTKKGVIFVNPGGPGGSAVFSVPLFAGILGRNIRSQFDIVGVDPRGVGGSDLAYCEGRKGDPQPVTEQIFPWKDSQYAGFFARDKAIKKMCFDKEPRILEHMTTADVARDMDRVRAAMGQKQINYYGVSYGSYLGATYANMFPSRVRSMVVDGVLDPVAWATGRGDEARTTPTTTRIGSGQGSQEALMAAIAECEKVGAGYCDEHATVRADWKALTTRLRDRSITMGDGDFRMELTYDLFIAMVSSSLYDPEALPDVMWMIHEFRVSADRPSPSQRKATAGLNRAYAKLLRRDRENRKNRIGYEEAPPVEEEYPPVYFPTFEGVVCSETRNPADPKAWIAAGKKADKKAPGFGPLWTWSSSVCAGLPNVPGAYHGPFTRRPAGGIMVMTTAHDPATPFPGAKALHSMSPGSRMVTVPGWGHATLDQSGCATRARNSYLVSGRLPKADLVCRPDHALFTSLD